MIKTTKPVIVDLFSGKKAVVTAELTSIDFVPKSDEYKIEVLYSYLDDAIGGKLELKNEVSLKSKQEIDGLFAMIGKQITTTME